MTLIDTMVPFANPPGNVANMLNWRSLSRSWEASGIIPGAPYNQQFGLQSGLTGGTLTIGTGAVWIDGFYGEATSNKQISGISGNGLVVLRMDPNAQTIVAAFNANATAPVQNRGGVYEVPLYKITGTTVTECRQWATATNDWTSTTVPPPSNGNYWPRGRMTRVAAYPTGTAWVDYGFDTVIFGGPFFSSGRFVCPISADYLAHAQVGFSSSGAGQWYNVALVRSGTPIAWNGTSTATAGGSILVCQVSSIIPCKGGDTIYVRHACSTPGLAGAVGVNTAGLTLPAGVGASVAWFEVRAMT